MKGAGRQVVAVLTATALLAVSGHTTAYAGIKETEQKLNEAKEEKKKTEEAIGDTKEEISSLQGTVAGLQQQLSGLNEDLEEVSNNLADLENRITQKEEEITQTQAELEEAKQIEADQYAAMKKRIQFMYEKRDYVMLEVLFGSADFADLLNRNDYFEQLSAYDRKKLTEFQETRAAVEDKEAALLQEKEDLDDLKVKVEAEQSKVSGLVSQTSGAISANQHLVSEAEKEMLAYEQQLAEQNNNIAELQKQLDSARQLNTSSLSAPASDLVREAKLEAGKILADARLYAESAEKELKQQADSQKNRMAENARSIASGVMLVRERLARVDERLSAATLDLDGLTQAIYQALDQTEAELKELGTDMRSFAQGTPETDPPAPLPPRPAAAQTPAAKPADRLRVKAKKAQPAHHTPPAPAHRLRNTRRPVSQLLQDQIDRLNGEEQ